MAVEYFLLKRTTCDHDPATFVDSVIKPRRPEDQIRICPICGPTGVKMEEANIVDVLDELGVVRS